MISFIESNLNFFIFFSLIFLTVDSLIIIIKVKKNWDSIPNLKISYDNLKSFYIDYENRSKFIILYLTVENISTSPIDLDLENIKLISNSRTYLSSFQDIINDSNFKFSDIDIHPNNVIENENIPSLGILDGYVFFKITDCNNDTEKFNIIIETPVKNKAFKKEIFIKDLNKKHKNK